jgi:hypothetical protein
MNTVVLKAREYRRELMRQGRNSDRIRVIAVMDAERWHDFLGDVDVRRGAVIEPGQALSFDGIRFCHVPDYAQGLRIYHEELSRSPFTCVIERPRKD